MVIVVVRWYIKKGREKEFRDLWVNNMEPQSKDGLFREFFSKPIDEVNPKYHTLDLESSHYTTYINIGIWRELADFDSAIGSFIPKRTKSAEQANKELIELFDFEFKLRERIVMNVEEDRMGEWQLGNPSLLNRL